MGFEYDSRIIETDIQITDYSVVMPVKRYIIPITQEFWDKKMTFYLVKAAKTWSGVKEFNNNIAVNGEYKDRGNWIYLVNANEYCRGLCGYEATQRLNGEENYLHQCLQEKMMRQQVLEKPMYKVFYLNGWRLLIQVYNLQIII